jgi:hypothetical protein
MKLIILRLDSANKPSPMSEGATEIRINSQPCKGINLTTRHTQASRAPRVSTVHDVIKNWARSYLALVPSSTRMPLQTPHGSNTIPLYTREASEVLSNSSTHEATQFRDSIWPVCVSTFQMLVHLDPTDMGLNWHRRGLPHWSSEF